MNPRVSYGLMIAAAVCFLIAAVMSQNLVAIGLCLWCIATILRG